MESLDDVDCPTCGSKVVLAAHMPLCVPRFYLLVCLNDQCDWKHRVEITEVADEGWANLIVYN